MSTERRSEVVELCEALCRDELSAEQQARLQELVKGDEELRRVYVRYLHMHVCLRRAFEHGNEAATVANEPPGSSRREDSGDKPRRSLLLRGRSLAAASVLLVAGLAAAAYWYTRTPQQPTDVVATLTNTVGCIWETPEPPVKGSALKPGRLELSAGMAELTFRDGAVVLVEAPAVLEIVDATRGYLLNGRIVVRVPKPAVGFVIDTPRARVLDLGTEFGVGVGNSGDTLVQVFDGAVVADFKNPMTGGVEQQRLTAGQTVQIDGADDAQPQEIVSVPQRFVRRMPPAKDRGDDRLVPYNRHRFEAMHIVPAPQPPKIDGDLSDWDDSGAFFDPCEEPFSRDYYVKGIMMYDKECVYIGAHVGDPAPMCSVIDPATDPRVGWKAGAVQVRLSSDKSLAWPVDAGNNLLQPRRRPILPQDSSPKIAHLTMWYYAPAQQPCLHIHYGMDFRKEAVNPTGFQGAFRKDADGRGYTLEYAIPWRLLNAADDPPRGGDVLGCTWNVHWSDEEGRVWRGYLVDVLNPNEKGFTYWTALTWGKAIYHPTGKLPAGTVVPR
jgi:ferric-dicitrate binding protein FerR (iron transport regulator)